MRVLFLTSSCADYLSDSLLHGLRSLLGDLAIDYPKSEILYKNYASQYKLQSRDEKYTLYGLGFTLYGLLEDIPINRLHIQQKVIDNYFDIVIFADIYRHFGLFVELLPYLKFENTLILDGADTPQIYPYAGKWWRYPKWWFLPKAHTQFLYFKREWTAETIRNLWFQLPPKWLASYLPAPKNLKTISFSIPEEKIVAQLPEKTKLFPKHIVDSEVANHIPESYTSYAFSTEQEYYSDLQASKFGITTKRSGWDCLRHYEIAANGCVPCFRDLDKKPVTCAPHGLNESNCIIYHNYDDLMDKINSLTEEQYKNIQLAALHWVKENTTKKRAIQILQIKK